jgi:hypothetical protein
MDQVPGVYRVEVCGHPSQGEALMSVDMLDELRRAFEAFDRTMCVPDADIRLRIALDRATEAIELGVADQSVAANLLVTHSRRFERRARTFAAEHIDCDDIELLDRLVDLASDFEEALAAHPVEQQRIHEVRNELLAQSVRAQYRDLPASRQDTIVKELMAIELDLSIRPRT